MTDTLVETALVPASGAPLPVRRMVELATAAEARARLDALPDPAPGERVVVRAELHETHDVWLIKWGAGDCTALHDHGGSAGVLLVVAGALVERRLDPARASGTSRRTLRAWDHRPVAASHVHGIANESTSVAASVHVYSPPLREMQHYEVADDGLRLVHRTVIDDARTADV